MNQVKIYDVLSWHLEGRFMIRKLEFVKICYVPTTLDMLVCLVLVITLGGALYLYYAYFRTLFLSFFGCTGLSCDTWDLVP